jgi:AcrR family transcriptional regulator
MTDGHSFMERKFMARIIDKEEKKSEIALSAIKLFCDKGIQQTSIDEIAKSAGVAKGTIYLYFKNKEEIIFTIWDSIIQHHETIFQQQVKSNMSSKEKILMFYDFTQGLGDYDKEQILILFQHFISSMLIDKTNLYSEYFDNSFKIDYAFISDCLKEGVQKGEFIIDDIEMLTNSIIMLLKGLIVKSKASNMSFLDTQHTLTKHISYLLENCTKEKQ